MKSKLEIQFNSITKIRNPQRRGIEFQRFLRALLAQAGFEVHENPRVARPRQSDLFAIHNNLDYLIEAKWLNRKIHSSDVDDLQIRLSRTPTGLIGCIVSMSEFASTAVQAVEINRQREILLFGPQEIWGIVRSGRGFSELMRFKRKALRIDGKVWFSNQRHPRSPTKQVRLPKSDRTLTRNNSAVPYIQDCSAWIPLVFTSHIPEFQAGGEGVVLEVCPQISSHSEFKDYLALLNSELGLTGEGSFTIAQTKCHWRGFGLNNFVIQASRWLKRYQEAGLKNIHHSEDLHYFDECHSGFLQFTIRQSVGSKIYVPYHSCRLTVWISGVPLDATRFINICANAREPFPFFQQIERKMVERVEFREGIVLEQLGKITSAKYSGEILVCGLVVKNPFFRDKAAIPNGLEKSSMLHALKESEHLICDMSDWHNLGSIADRYRLIRMQGVQIGAATIIRPVCTWDNIINRKYEIDGAAKPLPSVLPPLEEGPRGIKTKFIRLMPQHKVPKS